MLIESCSCVGCYRYTCYHCSACQRPFCMSHLHPRSISASAPSKQVVLCDACLQQPGQEFAETLNSQDRQHGWARPHQRPNRTIRYIHRHAKDYLR
jgi:hypothetical protein